MKNRSLKPIENRTLPSNMLTNIAFRPAVRSVTFAPEMKIHPADSSDEKTDQTVSAALFQSNHSTVRVQNCTDFICLTVLELEEEYWGCLQVALLSNVQNPSSPRFLDASNTHTFHTLYAKIRTKKATHNARQKIKHSALELA